MKTTPLLARALILASSILAVLPCPAAISTWTNTAGGNWNVAANWSPNGVPTGTMPANITTTGNYTVTVNDAESVGALTLGASTGDGTIQTLNITGGTLTVNSASSGTAQGILSVTGGTLAGAGALTLAGPLNWTGGTITGVVSFSGGTINEVFGLDGGTLINTGTLALTPYIYDGAGSVISNAASGIINVALNNNQITANEYGGAATFYNAGQINLSGTGFSGAMGATFINTGGVTISNGTFNLNDGGTNFGTITVATNATLQVGATYYFNPGSTVSGAGSANFSGGTVAVNNTYNLAGTNLFTGANVTFSGNYTITNQSLSISSGTVTFNAGGNLNLTGLTMSGGSLGGTLPVVVTTTGGFKWTGGTVTGVISFNGGTINEVFGLDGGTLINTGTLALTPYIYDGAGSVISNAASGIINVALNNNQITANEYGGAATFYNAGQINLSGTGFSGAMGATFINTGGVTISNGTFNLNGGGTNTGTITVATNATLQVGATYYFNPGSTVSGAGSANFSGGTVAVNNTYNLAGTNLFTGANVTFSGNYTITNQSLSISSGTVTFNAGGNLNLTGLTMSGGSLGGTLPVVVTTTGGFKWTGGTVTGVISFNGGTINEVFGLDGGTLINTGTLALTPYIYDGAGSVISNAASGIINVALNNNQITANEYGGAATFYNAGQINLSGTGFSGAMGATFINTGGVTISNGTFNLNDGGTNTGTMTVAAGATLQVGSTYYFTNGTVVSGAGTFQVNSGTANFNGAYSITNATLFTGGILNFTGSGTVNLASLTMSSGTLQGGAPVLISNPNAFNWTGGTITGVVSFNGATISQVNGLDGGTLINTGTLALTPYIYDGAGSVISNAASGIINVALNNNQITANEYGGAATFYNAGQINLSGTGFSGAMGATFINTGGVTISNGTVNLNDGGTNTGTMTVAAGATLQVGSTYYFTNGTVVSGTGTFQVNSGTANFNGAYSITNATLFTGGILNFTGSGTVNLASLTMSSGTLQGGAPVLISNPNAFNWTGGTITGVVSFNGATISQVNGLDGGTLINTGTLALTPYLYAGGNSVISNAAGGIINISLNNQPIVPNNYGGSDFLYNAGQINLSGAGFSGAMGATFINTGGVTISNGTVNLNDGGTNTGTMTVAAGATLQVGSTYYFTNGTVVSGTGTFQVNGGTANFNGAYSITNATLFTGGALNFNGSGVANPASLTISSGTLTGSNTVLVSGPLNWTGGTITDVVSFNGGTINEVFGLDGGTLINTGTLALTPYLYDGAGSVISNAASGIINVALNNNQITANQYGGAATFYNAGQINLSGTGNTGTINDAFTNTGTVTVNSGTLTYGGSYNLTNGVIRFGLDSATVYGKISLPGNPAPLAGTLGAILNSNYVPMLNTAFPVLNFTSSSGTFTNTNLPPVAVWQTTYNPANVTLTVLKLVPTITWPGPAGIVYGTPLSGTQLNATAASPGGGISLTGPGTFTYNPPLGTLLNASNSQVLSVLFTPSPADQADFAVASNKVTINVVPLPVILTGTRTYDATTAAASTILSVSNLVGSDIVTVASGSATLAATTVGSESITSVGTLALGGAQAPNYTLAGASGAVTLTAKTLTMSGLSVPPGKVYDGTTTAAVSGSPGSLQTAEATGTGATSDGKPYTGDVVSLTGTATGTYNTKDAATAGTVTFGALSLGGAQAVDYNLTIQSPVAAAITAKVLTMSGLTVPSSKVYDGTTTAAVSGSPGSLQTAETTGTGTTSDGKPYTGDVVSLIGTATGTYNTKDVATASSVAFGALNLGGAQAGDYSLTIQATAAATITAKTLTMSGLSVPPGKVYDGTTTATVNGSPGTLQPTEAAGAGSTSDGKPYNGDVVSLTGTATGTYNTKDAATANSVAFGALSLGGAQAGDYSLTIQSAAAATITAKALTMSGLSVPSGKVYDGTTTAAVTGSPGTLQTPEATGTGSTSDGKPYTGDVVSLTGTATGTYNTKDVATASAVTFGAVSLGGAQAADYSLTIQSAAAATITTKALTMSGLSVPASKIYDGTTTATVTGSPGTLQTVEATGTGTTSDGKPYTGDVVSLTGTATGTYNTKDVATASTVTFGAVSLAGAQAADYSLTRQSPAAATITVAPVTITSGITANNKLFDQTTTAALSSNNVVLLGVAGGDTITLNTNGYTANFAGAAVGNNIAVIVTGLSLNGSAVADYSLTQPAGLTASILSPSLQILPALPNVVLSWPTNASVFVLNSSPALSAAPVWTAVTTGITVVGTNNTLTVNTAGAAKLFYSLIAP